LPESFVKLDIIAVNLLLLEKVPLFSIPYLLLVQGLGPRIVSCPGDGAVFLGVQLQMRPVVVSTVESLGAEWAGKNYAVQLVLGLFVTLKVFLPLERSSVRTLWKVTAVHALGYPGEVHHSVTLAKPALLGAVES